MQRKMTLKPSWSPSASGEPQNSKLLEPSKRSYVRTEPKFQLGPPQLLTSPNSCIRWHCRRSECEQRSGERGGVEAARRLATVQPCHPTLQKLLLSLITISDMQRGQGGIPKTTNVEIIQRLFLFSSCFQKNITGNAAENEDM